MGVVGANLYTFAMSSPDKFLSKILNMPQNYNVNNLAQDIATFIVRIKQRFWVKHGTISKFHRLVD